MRNLLIIPIMLFLAGPGCQSLRRIEVWKQQRFFAPATTAQPVAVQAPSMAMPGQPIATPPCAPCAAGASAAMPTNVQSPVVDEFEAPTEGILPGPAESNDIGPIEDGPAL